MYYLVCWVFFFSLFFLWFFFSCFFFLYFFFSWFLFFCFFFLHSPRGLLGSLGLTYCLIWIRILLRAREARATAHSKVSTACLAKGSRSDHG